VIAVPESFDSMLAELADAAAGSAASPDLAAVRQRARRRTAQRRVTASALALALLCVAGVAGATVDGRFHRPSGVNALGGQGASSAASGAGGPTTSAASPGATTSASSFTGVWKADNPLEKQYLIVFPDGVVGVNETAGDPLCYAMASGAALSAEQQAEAEKKAAGAASPSVGATSAATPAEDSSAGSITLSLSLPFAKFGCEDAGASTGLTLSQGGSELTLVVTAKTSTVGYGATYARVLGISAQSAAAGSGTLGRLTGQWISTSGGAKQTLQVEKDGSVTYLSSGSSGSVGSEKGQIDAYYSVGARVLVNCSTDNTTASYCGILLIQPGSTTSEITVYSGSGPETFKRAG